MYSTVLRVGGNRADAVLAVSPLGLERALALCSKKSVGMVVPLLSDLPRALVRKEWVWGGHAKSVRFIYAGTHAQRRRLDIVIQGVISALESGVDAVFLFVGGKPQEIDALRRAAGVQLWENRGRIRFEKAVRRSLLPQFFSGADVGLSLIPPIAHYREASPTKLAEYMGAGLAVLASEGVQLQELYIQESNAGLLIKFDAPKIAEGIRVLATDGALLKSCKRCAERFATERLIYASYVTRLKMILHSNGGNEK